jgi:hypothetical protein
MSFGCWFGDGHKWLLAERRVPNAERRLFPLDLFGNFH